MPTFRKILAIDTSRGEASVAYLEDRRVVASACAGPPAEALLRLIGEVGATDPDLVVVGLGPGSFTGTRVGLSTAKGFAIASGTPVVGVCSLVGLARSLGSGEVALTSDAGRGEVYAAAYAIRDDAPAQAIVAPHLSQSAEGHAFGRAPVADLAVHVGLEGLLQAREGTSDVAQLEPLYVRPSDAQLPKTPLRVQSSTPSSSDE